MPDQVIRVRLRTFLVLGTLLAGYVGSYYRLVRPTRENAHVRLVVDNAGNAVAKKRLDANYASGSSFAAVLFWPMNMVDRLLRPGTWEVSSDDFSSLQPHKRRQITGGVLMANR